MKLNSSSVRDTLNIGSLIAKTLKPADVVCLYGELGSGKTVLAKGIARGLGVKTGEIISPTFVLLRQYPDARIPLYHFDLYRLRSPEDILGLGYEEYLYASGVTVIEWPDRLKYLLPQECLNVELIIKGASRRLLKFKALGARHHRLIKEIYENNRH
ncbi:MAG: tRNA (adenosine(37)-N6)-threonylcarbamoyltransferase complex ATPase subunit type 1 TsaE [Candidatus Omnitrophica bacterium]|nr:tRNA (adenosine(37)-N6)-threonylcarbamoyltransferase complex ATPase subunit type 1 TsaE [Candidatus Omnitrophota bacterium]